MVHLSQHVQYIRHHNNIIAFRYTSTVVCKQLKIGEATVLDSIASS